MNIREQKEQFELSPHNVYERACLKFSGVADEFSVYNPSAPFKYEGNTYIYGRVENLNAWADSRVILFKETEKDCFQALPETVLYPLEDPFMVKHKGEWLLGGVHVVKNLGNIKTFYCYFHRGESITKLKYFTTGPELMKDIRFVSLGDKIGVFTRPGDKVGYTEIGGIDELTVENIENAPLIDLIKDGGHGGVNQAIRLDTGLIALIGHNSYGYPEDAGWMDQHHVYYTTASVFDPKTRELLMNKIIATRSCFVEGTPARKTTGGVPLADVVFSSGIFPRDDDKIDLYAGVSDATAQRITIDNPFSEYGNLVFEW